MKLMTLAFGLGFFVFPLAAVWYPRSRWMNFCWAMFLACSCGLVAMTIIGGDDDFNSTVSDSQAEVQRVELLEAHPGEGLRASRRRELKARYGWKSWNLLRFLDFS